MTLLDIIKEYHALIWDKKDLSAVEKYFHPHAIIHSPLKEAKGPLELVEVLKNWHIGFPDLKVTWEHFICEGQKVVSQWHAEGTHTGTFLGIEPTNNTISYSGTSIYELDGNHISQYWAYVDMDNVKHQILAKKTGGQTASSV